MCTHSFIIHTLPMSQAKPPVLKLIQGDEIRKITDVPETLAALRKLLQTLFGSSDFQVKYEDEEGDLITIATDEELRVAYVSATGPSLKLILTQVAKPVEQAKPAPITKPEPVREPPRKPEGHHCIFKDIKRGIESVIRRGKKALTCASHRDDFVQQMVRQEIGRLMGLPLTPVHENVKCNGCGVTPITGVRFKCTQCSDFDFCELCEAGSEHPHPFLKVDRAVSGGNFNQAWTGPRFMGDAMPKMEMVSQQWRGEDAVSPGEHVYRSWIVKNTGSEPWPAATRLVYQRGDVYGETIEVSVLQPNQEVTIGLQLVAPMTEGKFRGCFSLVTTKGQMFGEELVAEVIVVRPAVREETKAVRK